jgi:hypothetical protein
MLFGTKEKRKVDIPPCGQYPLDLFSTGNIVVLVLSQIIGTISQRFPAFLLQERQIDGKCRGADSC